MPDMPNQDVLGPGGFADSLDVALIGILVELILSNANLSAKNGGVNLKT